MKLSKELKTGILIILGIVLFIFGFNYLKGQNLLTTSRVFYTEYDNVEGLAVSTPVTINGLIVGKVVSITFKEDGSGKLLVELLVDSEFQFSKNSTAELYETGLIGGKAVAIIPANDNAGYAENYDVLNAEIKAGLSELVNQRLTTLQEKIEVMMTEANMVLQNINEVFDDTTKTNLKSSFSGLDDLISNFKNTSNTLNSLVTNDDSKLIKTINNFEAVSSNLVSVSDSISGTNIKSAINNLETTLYNVDKIIARLDNGEGSIGKFLKDEELYNNMEGASLQLEQLLQDMKLNPKRYVHFSLFGKKPKRYDAEGNEIEDKN